MVTFRVPPAGQFSAAVDIMADDRAGRLYKLLMMIVRSADSTDGR
jgi:hypothetical protein